MMSLPADELLNTLPCGFVSFSDGLKIRLVNSTLLEILGYDLEIEDREPERSNPTHSSEPLPSVQPTKLKILALPDLP